MKILRRVFDRIWDILTGGGLLEDIYLTVEDGFLKTSWMEPKSMSTYANLKFKIEEVEKFTAGIKEIVKFQGIISIFPMDETIILSKTNGFITVKATKLPMTVKLRDGENIKSAIDEKNFEVTNKYVSILGGTQQVNGGFEVDASILISFARNAEKVGATALDLSTSNSILHLKAANSEGEEIYDNTKISYDEELIGKYSAEVIRTILKSVTGKVKLYFSIQKPLIIYRKEENAEMFWMISPFGG